MAGLPPIPPGWAGLQAETEEEYYQGLEVFLDGQRQEVPVYPPLSQVFRSLELTPRSAVRVVLIGQDPYHGPGQAHGLAFSVPSGVAQPPSLQNLLQELHDDVGVGIPDHGDLSAWARRGVLLLNAVLTVRDGEPGSHRGVGWERFTDAVIARINEGPEPVVFLLLGNQARKKARGVDRGRHGVVEAPHPSPLSAYRGFFGSRVFSRVDASLVAAGRESMDWTLL